MNKTTFESIDKKMLSVLEWNEQGEPKGIIQIIHSRRQRASSYSVLGENLSSRGYFVFCSDLRSHGESDEKNQGAGYKDIFVDSVKDVASLNKHYQEQLGLPIAVISQGYGSFLALAACERYADFCDALILGGIYDYSRSPIIGLLGKANRLFFGGNFRSQRFNRLSVGGSRHMIDSDALGSTDEQVRTFENDESFNIDYDYEFIMSYYDGIRKTMKNKNLSKINLKLPIMIASGNDDPFGKNGKTPKKLKTKLEQLDFADVYLKLYGGKHNYLFDYEKDKAISDICGFLERYLKTIK